MALVGSGTAPGSLFLHLPEIVLRLLSRADTDGNN